MGFWGHVGFRVFGFRKRKKKVIIIKMPKRYTKKRAKRTIKRRMMKRRRRLSARKPDGAYKEKVTIMRDMMTNSSESAWHGI